MADWGVGSSLRRLCAPTGALVALGLVLAVSAAAAPSPDPPPAPPAPPKTEPVQPTVTVVVRQAPVVTPAPVVQRPTPVRKAPVQAREAEARPGEGQAGREAEGQRRPPWRGRHTIATGCRWPRSSRPRPPTRSTATCSRSPASGCCSSQWAAQSCSSPRGGSWRWPRSRPARARGACSANASAAPVTYTLVGTAGANGWHTSRRHDHVDVESATDLSVHLRAAAG